MLYVSDYGANRYSEYPVHLRKHALMGLDHAIWHVQKYCFYMRGVIIQEPGEEIDRLPLNVAKVNSQLFKDYRHKYQLHGGFLEDVIKEKSQRKSLSFGTTSTTDEEGEAESAITNGT